MQDEITVSPLVDILSKQLSKEVVMSGDKYVYLDTKAEVIQSEIDIAIISQSDELLQATKDAKLKEINEDYDTAESEPVVFNEVKYSGGAESVTAIDGYVRLNRLAGLTTYNIWDVDGIEHPLNDTDVDSLLLAIGNQASINKFNKKNRKVAVDLAKTVEEIGTI